MLPPISTGWPNGRRRLGQVGVARAEGAGRALAVHVEPAPRAIERVLLDLAGVVRDVEQQPELALREESRAKRCAPDGR